MQSIFWTKLLRPILAVAVLLLLGPAPGRAEESAIAILQPRAEETVHNNDGTVAVSVSLGGGAGLMNGRRIRLLLDGSPAGPDGSSLNVTLHGVVRGEHSLQAVLVDKGGNRLAASEAVTFYMWQASRLFPSRTK